MKLTIHPDATRKDRESVEWYEDRQSGLGRDFDAEIEHLYDRIEEAPERGSRLETLPNDPTVRRVLVRRFPDIVIYELLPDEVHILAVAHERQRPNYWLQRRRHG